MCVSCVQTKGREGARERVCKIKRARERESEGARERVSECNTGARATQCSTYTHSATHTYIPQRSATQCNTFIPPRNAAQHSATHTYSAAHKYRRTSLIVQPQRNTTQQSTLINISRNTYIPPHVCHRATQRNTAQHSTTQRNTAQHSATEYSTQIECNTGIPPHVYPAAQRPP